MPNRKLVQFSVLEKQQVKRTTHEDEMIKLLKENNRILSQNRESILELQSTFSEMKEMLHKIVINTN